MNCHDFEIRLERLLEGDLEATEATRSLKHAAQCRVCGELLQAVGGLDAAPVVESEEPLIETILERTTGSVCGQAEAKLPAYVDHELATADHELLQAHLDGCAHCRRLVATLGLLNRELPRLAEAPADEELVQRILAATLPARIRVRRWMHKSWSAWVQRPRFAMEAAYAGLLIVMLVFGAFSTPLAALPQKGLDLVQPDPNTPSVWTQTGEGLGTFWEWVASLFEKTEEDPESTEETS